MKKNKNVISHVWQASEGEGKGKHARAKHETIAVGDFSLRAHFDFPSLLGPATQPDTPLTQSSYTRT